MSIWDTFLGIQDSNKARADYLEGMDTASLNQSARDSMDFGRGLVNYTSEYNRGMKRDYVDQAMDFQENQMRGYEKSFAMGGRPVNQAMLAERGQATAKDATNRGLMNFTQAYRQNLGLGRDFINQGVNTMNQFNQIMNNANQVKMGVDQANTGRRAQFLQGAAAMGLNALVPGLGSIMGGGTFSEGYSMPRQLQQMQMDYYNRPAPEPYYPSPRGAFNPSPNSGLLRLGGLQGLNTPRFENRGFKLKTN